MNWEIKKLGDICEINTGKSNTVDAIEGGEYAFFDRSKTIKRSSKYLFDCDAIIVAGEGQTFMPKYYSGKFDLHQRAYALYNFDKGVSIHYVFKYLIYYHKYFEKVAVGATAKSLRLRHFQHLSIPVPPLPIQKKIVAILDDAFERIERARENTEKNLANAKEIFESYLQSIFESPDEDWEEKTLEDVCRITSKLIDPKETQYHHLMHIGAGNIESQKGTLVNLKTAKEEKLISGKFLFDETMVLYSKIRPYLRKVVKSDFRGLCSADIYPLSPISGTITQTFLYYLLLSNDFTHYAIMGSQRAGMPKVNRNHLFNYKFHCPTIQEQNKIIEKIEALSSQTNNLESIYNQKIQDLEELKQSILQKAFNGELTEGAA